MQVCSLEQITDLLKQESSTRLRANYSLLSLTAEE